MAQEVTIMSYNCENAFDTLHDAGFNDTEYMPDGTRHWSRWRMYQKLRGIGQVIMAADTLRPVDIVCLEEVENDTVLTYLTRRTALSHVGYSYLMTHSADMRGIDVAIIYSPLTSRLLNHRSIRPATLSPTRDILHATFLMHGRDTIDVFATHMPSRLNGRIGTRNREAVADALLAAADSLKHIRQTPYIIILGDMNDGPRSKLMRRKFAQFINLADTRNPAQPHYDTRGNQTVRGSYKYQGAWENIDQILLSASLQQMYVKSEILALPFLLEPDTRYGTVQPRRAFTGYNYHGGISDHLPVMLRLRLQ